MQPSIVRCVALCASLICGTAAAQCQYSVTLIDPPPCDPSSTLTMGLNNWGHVVGGFSPCIGSYYAFFWSEESGFVPLQLGAPVSESWAEDINDSDQIVGWAVFDGLGRRWFRWTAGRVEILDPLPPFPPPYTSAPTSGIGLGVAPDGTAIGSWGNQIVGPNPLPLLWAPDGSTTSLLQYLGYDRGQAEAINGSYEIVGWVLQNTGAYTDRGFVLSGTAATILPPAPNSLTSRALGISSNGYVVGFGKYIPPGSSWKKRGFLWLDGVMTDLGIGPVPGGQGGLGLEPVAANALGQVTGGDAEARGFLWQDGKLYMLENLVVDPDPQQFPCYLAASGINDRGQILAKRFISDGSPGALLTPIRTRTGDVTIDCKVDARDIAALFEFWGKSYPYPDGLGDLDGNGFVDGYDLALVLGDWG